MTERLPEGEMLGRMLVCATNAHAGQKDKNNRPYILHCLAVHAFVARESDDEELQCIAIGHDIFEDSNVTDEDLRNLGMTERIVEGIRSMTKMPGEAYDSYKVRVKANNDSVIVKMADLRHNTSIDRMKGTRPKDFERLEKYFKFYDELKTLRSSHG